MTTGVDLSHHNDDNGPINFDLLAGHVDFIVTKVTQGTTYVDPTAARHISEARRIGVIPGLYHFPGWGDPIAEADFFVKNAGDVTGAFVAFDCEAIPPGVGPVGWSQQWLQRVSSSLGVAGLIYMNKSTLAGNDWSPVINGGFGLWEANYDGNAGDFSVTGAWPCVALKQYSDAGSIPGISGRVDVDSFNGSIDQLRKYCKAGAPPAPPAPTPPVATPWTVLPSLSYGQRANGSVRSLQSFLARTFPAYRAKCGQLDPTGNYLDVTTAWVREFQARTGIVSGDGRNIGPQTKAMLWAFGWRG